MRPPPRGYMSKQGTWTTSIYYRKRGAVLRSEYNVKREVTLTFPAGLLCVHNKTVLQSRDVGLVLF